MIIIKKLKWSNAFSYGQDNEIVLNQSQLLQLVGKNGHGKTSIILVLEEVLFNKNSKGIARGKVINRYTKDKFYTIAVEFEKDGVEYLVETKRGATQVVKLVENGIDISGHTATSTYKKIEEILGMDHKAFSQIVNQLSSTSLEFLTATDSARKKFLIDLLDQAVYGDAAEIFKAAVKELETELSAAQVKKSTIEDIIKRNSKVSLELLEKLVVPTVTVDSDQLQDLEFKLRNISATNKQIIQNNKYKELLDGLKVSPLPEKPIDNRAKLTEQKTGYDKDIAAAKTFITKMNNLGTQCPTCLSEINNTKVQTLVEEHRHIVTTSSEAKAVLEQQLQELTKNINSWTSASNINSQYEEYHALYDPHLSSDIIDPQELSKTIETLKKQRQVEQVAIDTAIAHNQKVETHNAKVLTIQEQNKELKSELAPIDQIIQSAQERLVNLSILVKTFSNTGLVAYKIECLVKDLEDMTNEYLQDLSGGRFQLGFSMSTGDKLNVVITDNGNDIEITALSGGERARVNVSALLGIRKLLQSLSNNRINLLFLDETIDSLDAEGKERLVDVLLREKHLNTVIVSHGFQHPLIDKVQIIKTNNISRIEYG